MTYLACADIGRPTLPRLDTFTRHSPTIFPGLDTFARHSPTISPDSIHSLTFDICHLRASNSPFWRIWGEWPLLSRYTRQDVSRYVNMYRIVMKPCILFLNLNIKMSETKMQKKKLFITKASLHRSKFPTGSDSISETYFV